MPKSVPSLEINASIIGPLKGCQHETTEAVQKDNLSNEGQNKITGSVKRLVLQIQGVKSGRVLRLFLRWYAGHDKSLR